MYCITSQKKGENCKAAITNYISIFKQYVFRNDKEIGYDAYLILNCIIQLSKRIRRDLSDVEELILTYLKSDDITDNIKQWILDSIKYNYKNWKLKGLEFVPELCIRMYPQAIDYGECKAISNAIDYSIPTLVEAGFIGRPSAGIYTRLSLNVTTEIALAAYRESFFLNNPLLNRSNDYDGNPYFEFVR